MACSLGSQTELWRTGPEYQQEASGVRSQDFLEISNVLLESPNLNSSHLFRADILFDSAGELKTPAEHEVCNAARERTLRATEDKAANARSTKEQAAEQQQHQNGEDEETEPVAPHVFRGFFHTRTVVRKLIPRNPQIDAPLVQTCHMYEAPIERQGQPEDIERHHLVVYIPRLTSAREVPWYHPSVKALAYLHEPNKTGSRISVHYVPFPTHSEASPSPRIHRTLLSLLRTIVRLCKGASSRPNNTPNSHIPKDNIIPQHVVQNTYTRLKQKYSADLISRWVEKTERSKHVFEDLSIAAFLIELWRQLYPPSNPPEFIDLACGNGILVYILHSEGYNGWGFDARRRKTWDALPGLAEHLQEMILIPQPFLDALEHQQQEQSLSALIHHNGIFPPNTFLISNHADELTPWTPLLAALSSPASSLPFLAIPCCSHALSGARHRYNTLKLELSQPATGDLKTLRASKANTSDQTSTYASLTAKVTALAQELGFDVEKTLMRIPSTRNVGLIGTCRAAPAVEHEETRLDEQSLQQKVDTLLARECAKHGGIPGAAQTWLERAQSLQTPKGRGKVNLGCHPS